MLVHINFNINSNDIEINLPCERFVLHRIMAGKIFKSVCNPVSPKTISFSRVVKESKQGGATEIELTIITPGTLLFYYRLITYIYPLLPTGVVGRTIINKLVTLPLIFLTYLVRRNV